jgi:AmiR/NasT family two-component response regulator
MRRVQTDYRTDRAPLQSGEALRRSAARSVTITRQLRIDPFVSDKNQLAGCGQLPSRCTVEKGQPIPEHEIAHLRVLIADERKDRLDLLAHLVAGLGHEVVASEIEIRKAGPATARERPDVALVVLGPSSEHALELIDEIVHEAACPVIALLSEKDPGYVREAARRGVFAYIVDTDPEELQSAIEITLQRFGEFDSLQGAFGRRAVIEQAKGILMERHKIDKDQAFEMIRAQSQLTGRKVIDVAEAIVESYLLLPPPAPLPPPASQAA